MAGPRKKRLKAVLEVDHRSSALAGHQLAQRVGSQGRAEASVQQFGEAAPWRCSLIALELHVPELGAVLQIVGRHPHLFFLSDPLLTEIRLTTIEEGERVGFAVELGEVHLLEARAVVVVLVGDPVALRGRGVGALVQLERVDFGLEGFHRGGKLGDEGGEFGGRRFSHLGGDGWGRRRSG